jgi:hypothetical protein
VSAHPTRRSRLMLALALCGAAGACGGPPAPAPGTAADPDVPAASLAPPLPYEPGALAGAPAEPVHGRVGPGGVPFDVTVRTTASAAGHPRRFGALTLETAFRTAPLEAYPCTSCHLPGGRLADGGERLADAHGNIQPSHPAVVGSTCSTCHRPDRVDQLALAAGEQGGLDHAYRLCAQCHAREVEAWAGGAHGKRLDGWHGRRVVMNCTECHDPHRPAIDQRVPFPGPQLPGARGH